MPCYDGRDESRVEIRYKSGVSPRQYEDCKKNMEWSDAALCALISALERRGIAAEVIADASRCGLIDIMGHWNRHHTTDETRLADKLHKFSKDEQAILKRLLR